MENNFSDKIPLDMMGKDPLDMNQYKKIFGTCRIPGKIRDSLSFNADSRHIVVAKNNNVSTYVYNNGGVDNPTIGLKYSLSAPFLTKLFKHQSTN